MSDARSLLRAQRAARRIEHPHAQYTDSGKLTCTICREAIKSEGLWENHTRSASHRQRFLALQKAKARPQQHPPPPPPRPTNNGGVGAQKPKFSTDTLSDEALLAQIIGGSNSGAGHKRKHGEDSDVEMADPAAGEGGGQDYDGEDAADAVRRKRSKQDTGSPTAASTDSAAAAAAAGMFSPTSTTTTIARNGSPMKTDSPVSTPPGLVRRSSGTPSQGVELQIPSRPATPSASQTPSTSTPKAAPFGRSPLMAQEGQMGAHPHPRQGPTRANFVTPVTSAATTTFPPSTNATTATSTSNTKPTAAGAEDDDWAAFEAEVVHAAASTTTNKTPTGSAAAAADSDAVISAAPLTAEQIAAKSEEEERAKRRAAAEIELEDEQEEAKRALETEFEEMEELEARVRRLKEKREAIRRGSVSAITTATATITTTTTTMTTAAISERVNGTLSGAYAIEESKKEDEASDEDDDDDDEEEEDDDWASFRFRG